MSLLRSAYRLIRREAQAHRTAVRVLVGFVVPLFLAWFLVLFRSSFANSAAALTFIAVITALAILGRRVSGFVASVSSALWFDFYLTTPYDKFTISQRANLEATICIVVVGIIISELAATGRRHSERAQREADYVADVHQLAVLASGTATSSEVIDFVAASLVDILELRDCVYERDVVGDPYARIIADGTVMHVGLQWPAREIGIPGPKSEIEVHWRGESLGRFVLFPTPGAPISLHRRIVAVSMANLAGAVLNRDEEHRPRN